MPAADGRESSPFTRALRFTPPCRGALCRRYRAVRRPWGGKAWLAGTEIGVEINACTRWGGEEKRSRRMGGRVSFVMENTTHEHGLYCPVCALGIVRVRESESGRARGAEDRDVFVYVCV